jgi:hypothetical protein
MTKKKNGPIAAELPDYVEGEYKGHHGNPNLKGAGVKIKWTKELLEEYARCKADPVYFCEKYMKIVHVDRGLIPIVLYPYQKNMIESMAFNRFTIVATARQAGKTTATCGFILWYIIFHDMKTVGILANKEATALEIMSRVQLAYLHLPKWIQQGTVAQGKKSFGLENGSRVLAAATSTDSIRGWSVNALFIDEAAHIEHFDAFYTSTYPTISSGNTTKLIMVSTPLGMNHFYKFWDEAFKGENEFHPIKVTWREVPGRDEKWRKTTMGALGNDVERFAQENEVEFLGSSGTLISGWKLKELSASIPIHQKNGLYQYRKPERDHIYCIVADTSRGKGLDYSACHVIDITELPYHQCAVYHYNYVTPIDYGDIIHNLGKMYNNAYVLVEINDIGQQVAEYVYYEYEYENVISTVNSGRLGKKVSGGFAPNTDRGIRTTKNVKSIGCSIAKLLIEQNQLILYDFNTIQELFTFSKKGVSFEAEEGKHDDLVMGLVLFGWLTDQTFFKDLNNINTLSALRDKSDEQIMNELLEFGTDFGPNEGFDEQPNFETTIETGGNPRHWLLDS